MLVLPSPTHSFNSVELWKLLNKSSLIYYSTMNIDTIFNIIMVSTHSLSLSLSYNKCCAVLSITSPLILYILQHITIEPDYLSSHESRDVTLNDKNRRPHGWSCKWGVILLTSVELLQMAPPLPLIPLSGTRENEVSEHLADIFTVCDCLYHFINFHALHGRQRNIHIMDENQ